MKPLVERARLEGLLSHHSLTQNMYVRVYGDHLIVGRRESGGSDSEVIDIDRVRLTRLANSAYGLSIRRHTGRWERTPFSGTMMEMVVVVLRFMQHLVGPS